MLAASPSLNYKFLIICSPGTSYYSKSLSVYIEDKYSRAAPGGAGYAKAAGNYGAAFYPTSLAIAQAAKETGWGTSRFALEGNALFGQWTWSGDGLKPKDAEKDQGHKVMKFNVLQASVRAYQRNLNTHSSYREFRKARAKLRDEGVKLDSIILSEHLDKYAETGQKYVDILQKIILQNNLKDFDDAKLLPSSKKLESLI